ncbi:MAG: hypothetical protein ACJ8F3_04290 [Xanthobacteraceae bacterium]
MFSPACWICCKRFLGRLSDLRQRLLNLVRAFERDALGDGGGGHLEVLGAK